MKPLPLPSAKAEFKMLPKAELRRLAEELLLGEPTVVDYCIDFVCAETEGLWHGRARAMFCRRLKNMPLSRSQSAKPQASILSRLESGKFSEQFKDQLRLVFKLCPEKLAAACARGEMSPHQHVRRYCAWAQAMAAAQHAA